MSEIDTAKQRVLVSLLSARHRGPLNRVLVVGCGSGVEAGILARGLKAETVGIDIGDAYSFDHEGSKPAKLMHMDAQALQFGDGSFDLVYSFHALEHIRDPHKAVAEMSRVLRPNGTFCIGTPNKQRLIGAIATSDPLRHRIMWNLRDLGYRLSGRWSNDNGAHAGFYARELRTMCVRSFGIATEITDEYYLELYQRHRSLLQWITMTRLKYVIFPCVYVAGAKAA